MPATVRAASGLSSSGTGVTVGETSASPQAGDIRYAFFTTSASATVSVPAGWTTLFNGAVAGATLVVAYRAWQSGVGSQTFSFSANTYYALELVSVAGVDPDGTPQFTTNGSTTAGTQLTASGLTPATAEGLLLAFYSQSLNSAASSGVLSNPSGMSSVDSRAPSGAVGYLARLSSVAVAGTAATGDFTSTSNASGIWRTSALYVPALVTAPITQAGGTIVSGSRVGGDSSVVSPPLGGYTETFSGTTLDPASTTTGSGAALSGGSLAVACAQNNGNAVYSSWRRGTFIWPGYALTFEAKAVPGMAGDTANAQAWIRDPNPSGAVDRLGFEYVASANRLDFLGQTGSYAAIGQTESVPYDPVAHRWWRITHTGSAIVWATSPDGLTWTDRRTLATPPAWTSKPLELSYEAFRTSGTNDVFRIDNINSPPPALPTTAPTGSDNLQRRTLGELRAWKRWLDDRGVRGYVGEFGWVTLYPSATGAAAWTALAEAYLTELDVTAVMGTAWASGREWGNGYPLGLHVGAAVDDPLTIANDAAGAASTVAAHRTRGTGTATRWRGVSVAGHERGMSISGGGTVRSAAPLIHTAADFLFLAAQGVDTIRLPLAWERLQTAVGAALDATALGVVDGMLTAARQAGLRVIVDLHNYGRYTAADGTVLALGGGLTSANLSDFWTRFVGWLTGNATRSGTVIGLGLMNEPNALPGGVDTWHNASQAALTAIRNAGDQRLILVAGYQFSSLTSWTDNHPASWINDPAGNFAYEAHHYWDTQSALGSRSGTYQQAKSGGGTEIETYATELAAADAALRASDVVVSGTVVTATPTLVPSVTGAIVSGTRVAAPTVAVGTAGSAAVVSGTRVATNAYGVYDAGSITVRSGSQVTAGASRSSNLSAPIVSGSQVTLAPSTPAAAPVTSGTTVTADPKNSGGITASVVSGSAVFASDTYVLPAVAALVRSGSTVTAAPRLDLPSTVGIVSGSRVDTTGVRGTTAQAPIVSGTQVAAGVIGTQAGSDTVTSGTQVSAGPQLTATVAASIVSGVVVAATPLGVTRIVSGAVVTAAPTQTEVATATLISGSVVNAAMPRGEGVTGDQVVSGTQVTAVAVTTGFVAARPIVSGSRVGSVVDIVKIGVMSVVSGSRVDSEARVAQPTAATLMSGTVVRVNASTPLTPVFVAPRGPVRPQVPNPITQILVAETLTGRVKWRLPWTAMTWSSPLNKVPNCKVTTPIESILDGLSTQRFNNPRATLRAFLTGPWRYSLVPCFGDQPLVGGPMLPNEDADEQTIAVQGVGMERMLEKRILNRSSGTGGLADKSRDVTFLNTTRAGAVYKVVAEAISGRISRQLPISCSRIPGLIGLETFTWPAYDMTKAWKAIEELATGTADGPDVRLEPMLFEDNDGLRVVWDLQIGGPLLPASGVNGPDGSPLPWTFPAGSTKVTRTLDPQGMATSYFAAGEGQDRSKVIARADSSKLTTLGWPDLEEVEASSGTNGGIELGVVQVRANSLVAAHGLPPDTWKAAVPVDRGLGIGAIRRGDAVRLEVRDKLYVEPGYYTRRITEVAGDGSRTATLTCEHEDDLAGVS